MTLVEFTNFKGEPDSGEVWSPGPAPRSVWVLLADGSAVAVHMAKRTEIAPSAVPFDPRTELCRCGMRWVRDQLVPNLDHKTKAYQCRECRPLAQMHYITRFRCAPKPILASEWARAVELFRVEPAEVSG